MLVLDYDALETANKVLIVSFIILITLINGYLIFQISRRTGYKQNPKSLILISLAEGDIGLAVFSLVISAVILFDNPPYICTFSILSDVYKQFLIHSLYGLGIVALAAELVARHKLNPSFGNYSRYRALLYGSIPWISLVIVCPLTLVNADWALCLIAGSAAKFKAMYWVSVLVPAILAVVTCVLAAFIKLTPLPAAQQSSVYGLGNMIYTPALGQQDTPRNSMHSDLCKQPKPPSYDNIDNETDMNTFLSRQNTHQVVYGTQQQPPQGTPHQPHQPLVISSTPSFPDIYGSSPLNPIFPGTYGHAPSNPRKEKLVLLIVAFIYFCLVLPQAVYHVSSPTLTFHEEDIVLTTIFLWLANFRSIITPAIWLLYVKD